MRLVGIGHALFALAAAGLAVLSFAYGDFAPIWQPLPAWVPWREAWVYLSALLVSAASVGLFLSATALPSAFAVGAYLAAWALTRTVSLVFDPASVSSWYGIGEALGPLVAAWVLYILLRAQRAASHIPFFATDRALRVAQVLFGLACATYGWAHFAYAEYTAGMVPSWLPFRLGFAYLTGLGHVAAACALMFGILPRLAVTLEAIMMSLFGLLVWLPTLFTHSPPKWALPPQNQWSEVVLTVLLAASAWIIAASLRARPWATNAQSGARRPAFPASANPGGSARSF